VAVGIILLVPIPTVWAYIHRASVIRFVEYAPETFETARRERKPLFLLVSAVWCSWCKTFDQDVLKNEEVSTYLNGHYVSIFVDYDRRPDLVRKYVRGLPMVVLFDSEGQVRQSFAGVLKTGDFLDVLKRFEGAIRTGLARTQPPEPRSGSIAIPDPVPVTPDVYRQLRQGVLDFLDAHLDTVHGGFGTRDKHAYPSLLAYLLEQYHATRDRRYLIAVEKSLDGILKGIYDSVDGGFFHYAEGREWREPHYEKLAHLNASLAVVFSEAHRVTRNPRYKEAADATLRYLMRTLYDAKAGGFYGSQTADPAYYRLPPQERRTARRPPVNRDKITEWNAEITLGFIALGQSAGRQDLTDVAVRTLEFMRRDLVTEKGVFHLYDDRTGRGQLPGQLESNAWAALAFLEGYRLARTETYRQAAERILAYARAELFDPARAIFGKDGEIPLSMAANGILAQALLRAYQLTGRKEYLETATRVLAALGGEARAILVEDNEAAAVVRVADTVFYLKAYRQAVTAGSPLPTSRTR